MNEQRIVILGAGFAGMMTALRLSRRLPKDGPAITLASASDLFVERTRLHQVATAQNPKTYRIGDMLRGTRVQFVRGGATSIQADQKLLTIETESGSQAIRYDTLVYALGSRPDTQRFPGIAQAFVLDASGARRLAETLPTIAAKRGQVLVIGGGLTGIEAATEIAESFPSARVALATRHTLGDGLSAPGAAHVRTVFERLGIQVHNSQTIVRIENGAAITASGQRLGFETCVNCAGFVASSLARDAGLAATPVGQLEIDAYMRSTSQPDIYGAGDAAAFEPAAHMSLRMACATAMPMAIQTADNLVARYTGQMPQPFAFGYVIRCISLGRRDALVQFVDARDKPEARILTGRLASATKEFILRYVTVSLAAERHFSLYQAPRATVAQATAHTESPVISLTRP